MLFEFLYSSDFQNLANLVNLPDAIKGTVVNINNDILHRYLALDTHLCCTKFLHTNYTSSIKHLANEARCENM